MAHLGGSTKFTGYESRSAPYPRPPLARALADVLLRIGRGDRLYTPAVVSSGLASAARRTGRPWPDGVHSLAITAQDDVVR